MKSPIEDTRWGSVYGSTAAVQAAFDRFGPTYHEAILASGVPAGAAKGLMPFLDSEAQGIDFGCGSGVLGIALRTEGLRRAPDGVDLSHGMLNLAEGTGCYRDLFRANLLVPEECTGWAKPYDFAVTVGLMGDYVPYYVALPQIVSVLKPGGFVGFAVERNSTPSYALGKRVEELGLRVLSETILRVPQAELEEQVYYFFVARLAAT